MGHGSKQDKPSPGLQDIGGKNSLFSPGFTTGGA